MLTDVDSGLKLSPGTLDGGVRRLPTRRAASLACDVPRGIGCVDLVCWNGLTEGRLRLCANSDAAGRRAVKLELGAALSMPEAMLAPLNPPKDTLMFASAP